MGTHLFGVKPPNTAHRPPDNPAAVTAPIGQCRGINALAARTNQAPTIAPIPKALSPRLLPRPASHGALRLPCTCAPLAPDAATTVPMRQRTSRPTALTLRQCAYIRECLTTCSTPSHPILVSGKPPAMIPLLYHRGWPSPGHLTIPPPSCIGPRPSSSLGATLGANTGALPTSERHRTGAALPPITPLW
jgi:hypothetical protein